MKFRILMRLPSGNEVWEDYDKQIGESNHIRGHGRQPEFTGDITAWGKAIIDWFNKDEQPSQHRTFIRAEMIEEMKTRPVPKDADMMTVEQFVQACHSNAFTDDDGTGYFCLTWNTMTNVPAVPSKVVKMKRSDLKAYAAVGWFNK